MPRARDDAEQLPGPPTGFMRRRRPLGAGETVPSRASLADQLIVLSKSTKLLRKSSHEPEHAAKAQTRDQDPAIDV
jgi:hypothetical protein